MTQSSTHGKTEEPPQTHGKPEQGAEASKPGTQAKPEPPPDPTTLEQLKAYAMTVYLKGGSPTGDAITVIGEDIDTIVVAVKEFFGDSLVTLSGATTSLEGAYVAGNVTPGKTLAKKPPEQKNKGEKDASQSQAPHYPPSKK